jgi:hypothetical protein
MRTLDFSFDLILLVVMATGSTRPVTGVSDIFLEVKGGWHTRLTSLHL